MGKYKYFFSYSMNSGFGNGSIEFENRINIHNLRESILIMAKETEKKNDVEGVVILNFKELE